MDKKKQKIKSVGFDRETKTVYLSMSKQIPDLGYGAKELIVFLNEFDSVGKELAFDSTQNSTYPWDFHMTSSETPTPHRCPICNGSGIVPPGFYNSTSGFTTSNVSSEPCRQCSGTGIIWSK